MAVSKQQFRFARSHDGVRLAWATPGSGPPLIKVATWLSHLEYDIDSPVWGHLVRELPQQCTYVRYDERGCGLSDWAVDDLSFESWVVDLEAVVDAAGLDRFALLGISQGASIAIAYAVRHPERVTHLVMHGGYARGRLVRSDTPEQRDEAEMMIKLAELGWGKADPAFRQFFTTQFIPGGTPEQHRWFNEHERISTSPANAARFMREFARIDVVGAAAARAVPDAGAAQPARRARAVRRRPPDRRRHPRRALRADRQPQPPAARKRARLAPLDRRGARLPAAHAGSRRSARRSTASPSGSASCWS